MYVYGYVYLCMYVLLFIATYGCCIYVWLCTAVCMYFYVWLCMDVWLCIAVFMYGCVLLCMAVYVYMYGCVLLCIVVYACIAIYCNVCLCLNDYVRNRL